MVVVSTAIFLSLPNCLPRR